MYISPVKRANFDTNLKFILSYIFLTTITIMLRCAVLNKVKQIKFFTKEISIHIRFEIISPERLYLKIWAKNHQFSYGCQSLKFIIQ